MAGMNRRDLVLIASRIIALYLLIPTLLQLLLMPFDLLLMHRMLGGSSWGAQMARAYNHALPGELFTDAVKLILAWLFWKCGPMIERLFSE
jgi:hypothetical protein